MKKPLFGPMILALAIFCVMLFIPNRFLLGLISDKKVEEAATSLDSKMYQGIALQKKMLGDKQYLPMYGSSELLRLDVYHPSNYFKVNPDGFTPFLIGRGGTQSFVQFMNLAATIDELQNKKIVFVLSPQWFTAAGLDETHFAPNFSVLQAYDLVFNNNINASMKEQAAKRLLGFEVVKKDNMLTTLLEGIVHNGTTYKVKALAMKPFAYTYRNILERRDLVTSIFDIRSHKPNVDASLKSMSWPDLRQRAEQTGAQESQSNPYGIDDKYYTKGIARKYKELKGYKANESYAESPEYNDLQMILDLLKQQHAKALFISVPVNGPWYDYAEFPKEKRAVYYDKVRKQVEAAGFPVADFSNHEYDKYFLKDTMHVGWKGWVYVDEALKQFHDTKY